MIGPRIERRLRGWSPRWRPNRFRATLIALPVLAVAIPLGVLAIPYLDLLNDMAVQPKGKPQGTYGWYVGNQTRTAARAPVAGTVPMRGWSPYEIPGNDEASRKLAAERLQNPLRPTREVLERGQKWFQVFCIVCHGPRGEGDGKIVGPNLFPAPPSLHTPQARGFADGHVFHVITAGQNKMPSYADRLAPEDRWAVVHYVRALQRAKKMAEEAPK